MHIPSGCSKLETSVIIDKVKGLIFGNFAYKSSLLRKK
jgi:hypothetical protein